jgi:hypothetical protein
MAKNASPKSGNKSGKKGTSKSVARLESAGGGGSGKQSGFDAGDAFIKLLQSPLVAELVAVAATAALASLAEHGFTTGAPRGRRAGKAVKEAGKAAAAAVGRRLGTEIDEIRKAAKASAKA